ncbi:MAG: hypothetical protein K8W52_09325 [Deltaproteobacteria bacterium]|nr:hypothetical protein [Deltaproteobacteria bacterium]
MSRRAAILVLAGLVAIAAAPARADERAPAAVKARLADGQRAYDDQDYAAAIRALTPITRDPTATRAQRLRALELIALSQFIRRDLADARDTFERILDIDPGFELTDRSGSPRLRTFFEDLKRELVPGYGGAAELEHAAPDSATAGRAIELEVRAVRGAGSVANVVVHVRRRGELTFRDVDAAPHGPATWHARWTLEGSARPYAIDYYIEGRDRAGTVSARIAAPDQPLTIPVAAGTAPARRRWYTRWYVVAGAAVLVGGATSAVIFAGSRDAVSGSLPPGTITVTP